MYALQLILTLTQKLRAMQKTTRPVSQNSSTDFEYLSPAFQASLFAAALQARAISSPPQAETFVKAFWASLKVCVEAETSANNMNLHTLLSSMIQTHP